MTSKTIVALDGIPATVTQALFSRPELAITVAAVALASAGAVVAITLATRDHPANLHPQSGKPPVPANVPGPGGAAIRQAFAQWPKGSLDTLQRLGQDYPKSPVVQLYLGIGLFWDGYDREAETALEAAKKYGRDTPWEIAADNVLHPQFFTGYPVFAPVRPNALLSQGARLQAAGHQHSAERIYRKAARLAPGDDQAQVAAAVGRFDKDKLAASFSQLGPLTRRFPHSQVVRFYLGLLLAWTGQANGAVTQFQKTVSLGPKTSLGRSAQAFIDRVRTGGTGSAKK
jgi:tetratricopeptide (TPR) repeat protein